MASDISEDLIIKQIQALNDTNKFYDILSLISNSNSSHLHLHNTTEVFSEEEFSASQFIRARLGEQHLEYSTLIPLTVIYGLFLVLGVLGNLATCIVILRNEYMRTTTNIYLFNLAVADLLTLLFAMPIELYLMWRQYPWTLGEVACDIKVVVNETLIYTSILTIVAFTIERYQAICHPLTLNSRTGVGRARRMIVLIWVTSVVSAYPWSIFAKVNYVEFKGKDLEESAWCSMPFDPEGMDKTPLYFTVASTILYFLVPFTIVFVLYTRIGLEMKANKMERCASSDQDTKCQGERMYNQGKKTVIRMLVAVVVAFFICWIPFHSQRLMFVVVTLYREWTVGLQQAQHVLFMVSGVFYYFNSILNPILYTIMSKRFRRGFNDMTGSCSAFWTSRQSSEEESSRKFAEFNLVVNITNQNIGGQKSRTASRKSKRGNNVENNLKLDHHGEIVCETEFSKKFPRSSKQFQQLRFKRCPRYYCEDGAASDEFLPTKAHSEPPGLGGQCHHRYNPDILVSSGEVTVWKTRIVVNNSVQ